jgi:hypothetical protein
MFQIALLSPEHLLYCTLKASSKQMLRKAAYKLHPTLITLVIIQSDSILLSEFL